jgi:hypothetical protein
MSAIFSQQYTIYAALFNSSVIVDGEMAILAVQSIKLKWCVTVIILQDSKNCYTHTHTHTHTQCVQRSVRVHREGTFCFELQLDIRLQ